MKLKTIREDEIIEESIEDTIENTIEDTAQLLHLSPQSPIQYLTCHPFSIGFVNNFYNNIDITKTFLYSSIQSCLEYIGFISSSSDVTNNSNKSNKKNKNTILDKVNMMDHLYSHPFNR